MPRGIAQPPQQGVSLSLTSNQPLPIHGNHRLDRDAGYTATTDRSSMVHEPRVSIQCRAGIDLTLGGRERVFVMVLGYSRRMVVRVCFDQKIETWLRAHVEAFDELGGAPRTTVPDNLKAVVRAAFGVDSPGDRLVVRNDELRERAWL
ncbi:MAG: transposase [Deltaproteobacteria bacterium]|nr:transposase [Deltaproteobacteria bacterium]